MLKKPLMFVTVTTSILASLVIPALPLRAATFIEFNSQPGDYIGGGRKQTLTPIDGYITASGNFDNGVSIHFDGDTWWDMDFAAAGNGMLLPGIYEGATRFPFQSSTQPGLSVGGDGRGCNTLKGSFNVLEAIYGSGGEVERFDADFEQHCEGLGPALFGKVRFNKADAKASADAVKQNTQIPETDLQKLLTFSDKIQDLPTALYFFSEPGDYIGAGREQTFTPADLDFNVSRNFDSGVSFSLNNFNRNKPQDFLWWNLDFASPKDLSLVAGNYGLAYRFPFQSPTHPGLSVGGDGRGCNQLSGQFTVLEAAYKPNGDVEHFDAIFKQSCEKFMPPLYGRIRYNATIAATSVPEPTMVLGLLTVGGFMLTQRRRSKVKQPGDERLIENN